MNKSGVRNASAEPMRVENKRERRRGAAGRAAVLRRAPSDSDCSGETASLSADSGERAPRPQPLPPRSGKTRSRRRGSEWEVLEGLKDGQRFEKRPDVFNGYLHKKRKWPLKGWHKRFFVVDGGILVYARSPTDVARGRLHGSVDVGLSVISAKQRRRRIDIDADEFIYHLRAKTPELFRTWLNVLKAHRLYRQHLLTFGARESCPKVHQPLDELPPTDASSRTSHTSLESSLICSSDFLNKSEKYPKNILSDFDSTSCYHTTLNSLNWPEENTQKSGLIPLTFEPLEIKIGDVKFNDALYHNHRSLCSMNCVARRLTKLDLHVQKPPDVSPGITDAERQMICTDLDLYSLRGIDPLLSDIKNCNIINSSASRSMSNIISKRNKFLFLDGKAQHAAAYFFFSRKRFRWASNSIESPMRKSKKSTNLVKYKNTMDEPTLKRPLSKCMLLGKYKLKTSRHSAPVKAENRGVACDAVETEDNEVQVNIFDEEHKSLQDQITASDYDKITERLMASVFETNKHVLKGDKDKHYINHVVRDLYDDTLIQSKHPVKALFRSLLEYWLKNTSVAPIQYLMTHSQSVGRQSNKLFTKDENISRVCIGTVNKSTQVHGLTDLMQYRYHKKANANRAVTRIEKRKPPNFSSPRRDTESFEKERRIQELEKLLKNTVYICETERSSKSKEVDIKITKTLLDNLEKISRKSDIKNSKEDKNETSNSSTEKIQETINRLISDTALSRDIAKEFLSAYLGVLMNDGSKSLTNTSSQSSDLSVASKRNIVCDVQTDSVIKRVSKSITTFKHVGNKVNSSDEMKSIDPGQLYLKDVLDKITTIFSKVNKFEDNNWKKEQSQTKNVKTDVDKIGRSVEEYSMKNLIQENFDGNSLVINLSRYGLENISMYSDPSVKGSMSITIKLKEKLLNIGESNRTHVSLKFSDSTRVNPHIKNDKWFSYSNTKNTNSKEALNKVVRGHKTSNFTRDFDLKQYLSNSDATSKAYRVVHESEHSLDLSFQSDSSCRLESETKKSCENDDTQSCYIMSFKKGSIATKFQSKRKVSLKGYKGIVLSPGAGAPSPSPELSVFEKPAPRVIDEKFILLLLENLTLLSKRIPSLNRDINNLYVKLRKKHEKVLKSCGNVQGLSLLGKIYNEDNPVCPKDATTQYDTENSKTDGNIKEVSTNTSEINARVDENVSAMDLKITNTNTQTADSRINSLNAFISRNNFYVPDIAQSAVTQNHFDPIEQATSNPKWMRDTRECSISTVIKCVIDNEQANRTHPLCKPITYDKPLRKLTKVNEKSKEFTLLSPTIKVSTQSQTERQLMLFMKDKIMENDLKVYSLFVSNKYEHVRSSSMTDSTMELEECDDLNMLYKCTSNPSYSSGLISPTPGPLRGPKAGFVSGTPGGRLASWIIESGGPLENASCELGQAQLSVQQLQRLLDALELQQQVHHDTDVSLEGASPNVKKDRRKFGLRKKKSNSKCTSVELQPPHIDPSSSHMALSALTAPPSPGGGSAPNSAASLPIACAAARPQSLPGAEILASSQGPASLTSLTPDHQLREDFNVLAKDLVASLKSIVSTLVCERGRLRAAMDAAETATSPTGAVVAALRTNLTSALQQNSELRSRLCRIHDTSDLAEVSSVGPNSDPQATRQFQQSLSFSSSCVSASEFFDAEEHDEDMKTAEIIEADEAGVIELDGDSSSDAGSLSSEEGSASSDNSDVLSAEQVTLRLRDSESSPVPSATAGPRGWSRRTRLPAPRPTPGGPSLWNLLYKNIGKDLSQISMPVTINEPLNMLQRLCEELEYSELLDSAAECSSAVDRMSLIAAFAVSAYASSAHRAASKPFNPLLAETYECVRDDKGFRFVAEQVSHHPPISACHAESSRWCFWQEARIKTKFWGKSMEFQPTGRVHVRLANTGDHYSWNKVTTCVHNLFGGQRWVDQYGDMHITCHGTDISCKLNFVKASSWSSSRHEVRGAVTAASSGARLRLAGRWSEALYAGDPPAARCLWRPGAMPPEHELYYGFTRFAMELNEMEPGMRDMLPYTDTRLRPDQRALEEGDVEAAEQFKLQLEQGQRERRRGSPDHAASWFRKTSEGGEETWVFSGEYWAARSAAFPRAHAPHIW